MNLVLVTSVINVKNNPLSYSKIRSVFNREERFEQTKRTIESIKCKIPDSKILIVEYTNFTKDEQEYFKCACDFILNLWGRNDLESKIFGKSKALGEGTMTIEALKWIIDNNINYENLFKISGRYWLSDNFEFDNFNNDKLIFKKINGNIDNIFTALYKIPKKDTKTLLIFLENNIDKMIKCVGYEVLFSIFLKDIGYKNICFYDPIGLQGFVTVCGSEYNG